MRRVPKLPKANYRTGLGCMKQQGAFPFLFSDVSRKSRRRRQALLLHSKVRTSCEAVLAEFSPAIAHAQWKKLLAHMRCRRQEVPRPLKALSLRNCDRLGRGLQSITV